VIFRAPSLSSLHPESRDFFQNLASRLSKQLHQWDQRKSNGPLLYYIPLPSVGLATPADSTRAVLIQPFHENNLLSNGSWTIQNATGGEWSFGGRSVWYHFEARYRFCTLVLVQSNASFRRFFHMAKQCKKQLVSGVAVVRRFESQSDVERSFAEILIKHTSPGRIGRYTLRNTGSSGFFSPTHITNPTP
jgi:hypothetical protein